MSRRSVPRKLRIKKIIIEKASSLTRTWRRRQDSNRRIKVLQFAGRVLPTFTNAQHNQYLNPGFDQLNSTKSYQDLPIESGGKVEDTLTVQLDWFRFSNFVLEQNSGHYLPKKSLIETELRHRGARLSHRRGCTLSPLRFLLRTYNRSGSCLEY